MCNSLELCPTSLILASFFIPGLDSPSCWLPELSKNAPGVRASWETVCLSGDHFDSARNLLQNRSHVQGVGQTDRTICNAKTSRKGIQIKTTEQLEEYQGTEYLKLLWKNRRRSSHTIGKNSALETWQTVGKFPKQKSQLLRLPTWTLPHTLFRRFLMHGFLYGQYMELIMPPLFSN